MTITRTHIHAGNRCIACGNATPVKGSLCTVSAAYTGERWELVTAAEVEVLTVLRKQADATAARSEVDAAWDACEIEFAADGALVPATPGLNALDDLEARNDAAAEAFAARMNAGLLEWGPNDTLIVR